MHVEYDPFSPAVRTNPYAHYRRLRDHAPVYWAEDAQVYVISRFDDVRFVLTNPELFSSDAMKNAFIGVKPGIDPMKDPESVRRMLEVAAVMPFGTEEMVRARNVISCDPPQHGAMRKIVNRGFTPRRIAAYEARVRDIVAGAMRKVRSGGTFDVIADLAIPLPMVIIAEMLGVAPDRRADFKQWSDTVISYSSGSGRAVGPSENGFAQTMGEISRYLISVIEAHRADPREDLISTIITAEDGEVGLEPMEVVTFVITLLVAGNETTTNLIGNATNALLDHPDEIDRVRRDRSLIPAVVEETLRYDNPIQFLFRRARQDVEVAGTPIPQEAIVMPLLGSANRDERRFPRPDLFDITRDFQGHLGHLGFGFGIHFCLGAHLARLEARIALEAMIDELPGLVRRQPDVEYADSFLVRGPRKLELARAA
jgi:cytochrome P450